VLSQSTFAEVLSEYIGIDPRIYILLKISLHVLISLFQDRRQNLIRIALLKNFFRDMAPIRQVRMDESSRHMAENYFFLFESVCELEQLERPLIVGFNQL
jgi:hypothetical protein